MMGRVHEKRKFGLSWKSVIGSLVKFKLSEAMKDYDDWKVVFNGDDDYEVTYNMVQRTIDLAKGYQLC